jgi:DNA-binding response OmpR family regulator
MPRKSGLEMIQELRKENREVNIIAMSGVDIRDGLDVETITRGFGVKKTIQKPFHMKDLLGFVEELLV